MGAQTQANQEQTSTPRLHDAGISHFRCPISWGKCGGGLPQAALDAMSCTELPDDAPCSRDRRFRDSPKVSRSPRQLRRRRASGSANTQKADVENLGDMNSPKQMTPGKITPAGSTDKNVESSCHWSPQRRPSRLGLSPLS